MCCRARLDIYQMETSVISSCKEEIKHTPYIEHTSLVSLNGFRYHSLYIKCIVRLKYTIAIKQFRFTVATNCRASTCCTKHKLYCRSQTSELSSIVTVCRVYSVTTDIILTRMLNAVYYMKKAVND
jgi:hypothetical protein